MCGSKAARVERWRNLQPYVGDCKVGVIPHRHITELTKLYQSMVNESFLSVDIEEEMILWNLIKCNCRLGN